jgi:K+-transporting ATPase KdpF subunit
MLASSIDNVAGLVAAILLTAYLVVVLIVPEKF